MPDAALHVALMLNQDHASHQDHAPARIQTACSSNEYQTPMQGSTCPYRMCIRVVCCSSSQIKLSGYLEPQQVAQQQIKAGMYLQ